MLINNESDLVRHIMQTLNKQFGVACDVYKNHGNQYQERGRPDIEGGLYGRRIVIEAKTNSRFSPQQKNKLYKASRAGSISGGIVYIRGNVYWLSVNQCVKFSLRDISKWRKIGDRHEIDWSFLNKYLEHFIAHYHGALDELS